MGFSTGTRSIRRFSMMELSTRCAESLTPQAEYGGNDQQSQQNQRPTAARLRGGVSHRLSLPRGGRASCASNGAAWARAGCAMPLPPACARAGRQSESSPSWSRWWSAAACCAGGKAPHPRCGRQDRRRPRRSARWKFASRRRSPGSPRRSGGSGRPLRRTFSGTGACHRASTLDFRAPIESSPTLSSTTWIKPSAAFESALSLR